MDVFGTFIGFYCHDGSLMVVRITYHVSQHLCACIYVHVHIYGYVVKEASHHSTLCMKQYQWLDNNSYYFAASFLHQEHTDNVMKLMQKACNFTSFVSLY